MSQCTSLLLTAAETRAAWGNNSSPHACLQSVFLRKTSISSRYLLPSFLANMIPESNLTQYSPTGILCKYIWVSLHKHEMDDRATSWSTSGIYEIPWLMHCCLNMQSILIRAKRRTVCQVSQYYGRPVWSWGSPCCLMLVPSPGQHVKQFSHICSRIFRLIYRKLTWDARGMLPVILWATWVHVCRYVTSMMISLS
jgi:hypothetical protein